MAKKQIIEFDPDTQDAVIYTRYSSHNQRDCSIEQQVADCEIFARQNNLRVVKVYADRHLSGTTDNRPQFQQMLKEAAHGHWAYVICWKIDRFARNRYDSATYKFRLKKAGVRVLYAKESIPDGPEGILLESVLEGSAEYYSAALAQNIRRGMKYNAEQCKVNSGSIPFGYCKGPDGRFAIHEANAEVVREIFRKAAAGMSFVDIANDLNSQGLKTSRGGRWNKGSFRLLMNEAYIGVYHFSDTRIEGGMPALIDQGTFWAANERLKANSSVRGRHQDGGDYLLTGKLKCAHCGSYMIGFSGTGKSGELHYYYGCQKRRRERACKKANVPREWIERVVVKAALDYVLRPDVMEWIADAVMEYQEREAASAQLAALTAELEENQNATDNVMKAIEAGIITSTTKQRLLDLEAKAQDLKRAIELEKLSHVRLERDQVLFWLDCFRGGSLQSQEFRRKVIDTFVSVVYLSDDHLRIAFNYSGGSNAEADFDLVMDAEAAAGELSKKFAQGHVASTTREPDGPSVLHQREEPHRFAVRLFPFHLIASLSHEIKQHVNVLTDGAEIVSSAEPASIVPGAAAHLRQELFLPHQNGVSDPFVFLYEGFQLLIFFYDTDVGQVLREGTGIEPVRLRVKVQRRQRVQRLIGVPHIGMPVIFFRRLLEASYSILGLADRLVVVEQRLSIVTIELVGVRIAVCIVLVLERLDALRPRGKVKPDAHRLRMGGQSCHDRQGQNPRCDRRNKFSSHDKTSFL